MDIKAILKKSGEVNNLSHQTNHKNKIIKALPKEGESHPWCLIPAQYGGHYRQQVGGHLLLPFIRWVPVGTQIVGSVEQ